MIDRLLRLKRENKTRALEYKGSRCQKCGYDRCEAALAFHHKDPKEKEFCFSGSAQVWPRLQRELDKAVLLCCRCHAELHAGCWAPDELAALGLAFFPTGANTGAGALPPSKCRRGKRAAR
jgi:hypothetical protein